MSLNRTNSEDSLQLPTTAKNLRDLLLHLHIMKTSKASEHIDWIQIDALDNKKCALGLATASNART
jgi:hypothetical protein